jgi:NAD(P)-dependent dehydrogenase (short-subunit alcohol dehydrogenase family)
MSTDGSKTPPSETTTTSERELPWTSADLPELSGRTAVVTGASSGLGLETSRALAGAGAHVVLAVRDVEKGELVAGDINGSTEIRALDLADLASIRAFAEGWRGPLDVLINNAGVMAVPEARTVDGFELQIGTNHLGPFLLTNLLLPSITDRVVTVSSQAHYRARLDLGDLNWRSRNYHAMRAYSDSKLANLLFTLELQAQLTEAGSAVRAIAAHPGIARTNLAKRAGAPWPALDRYLGWLFNDAERGALPIEYAATEDVPGGSYVGPNGLGHVRGYPEIHQPAKSARDCETARQLWELSARLTGTRETIRVGPESRRQMKAA